MDDRTLIEKMEAIREVIAFIEKKEQLSPKETFDNLCSEENVRS
jgi:hypothetical protein